MYLKNYNLKDGVKFHPETLKKYHITKQQLILVDFNFFLKYKLNTKFFSYLFRCNQFSFFENLLHLNIDKKLIARLLV